MKPGVSLEQHNLPPGWKWTKLGDVISGFQPGFACGKRNPNGVVQVRMNNVTTNGSFNWEELVRVPNGYTDMNKYWLKGDDVLFNNTNSAELVGKSAIFLGFQESVVFSNHFSRVRTNPTALAPDFLAKWLNLNWQQGLFEKICNRWVGQAAVDRQKLLKLDVPLPPLEEQRRIVGVLNEQMAAVERAKKAAAERLEAAQALREAHRESVFNSLDRSLSKLSPLKTAISSTRNGFGRRPKGEEQGPIVLRIADVSSGQVSYSDPRRVYMTPNELETYSLQPGDLLFVRVNGSQNLVGACVEFEEWAEPVAFNDHLIRVRLTGGLDSSFVAEVCKRRTARTFLENRASTSAGQFTINRSSIEDIEIPVPDSKTQARCVSEIRSFDKFVNTLAGNISDELNSLDSLQSSLLRRAFSGEV